MKIVEIAKDIKKLIDKRSPNRLGGTTIQIVGDQQTGKSFLVQQLRKYIENKIEVVERDSLTPQLKINQNKVTVYTLQKQDEIYNTNCDVKYVVQTGTLTKEDAGKLQTIFGG